MPIGGLFDCSGLMMCVRGEDGKFAPVNITEAPPLMPEVFLTKVEVKRYNFSPAGDFKLTAKIILSHKTQIELARRSRNIIRVLKRYNNVMRRLIRTEKRLREKERRRRLKEGNHA